LDIHKRIVLDGDHIQSFSFENGGLIFGMAGTSKSTTLNIISDFNCVF
jgi:hypothetical protein